MSLEAEILSEPLLAAFGAMRDVITRPVARFLEARAETLSLLGDLVRDYRKTVLENEKLVPQETKDPGTEIVSSKELENLQAMPSVLLMACSLAKSPMNERPSAFIYGLCSIQDAKLRGTVDGALGTLTSLGPSLSYRIRESSIEDATRELENLVANQPQLLL